MQIKLSPKIILFVFLIISLLLSFFPLLSFKITEGESAVFTLNVFNLSEFSPVSILLPMSILLIPMILFSKQTKNTKIAEIIFLTAVNPIGYMSGIKESMAYFSNALPKISPNVIIYPFSLFLLCLTAWYFSSKLPD